MLARLRNQGVHHLGSGGGIQVACGFVGQYQRRAVYQGAGNGYALQLAARQLLGQASTKSLQTNSG